MRVDRLLKTMGPLAALVALGALAGCNGRWTFEGDDEGVPLAELDLSGDPPEAVSLAGPDTVTITEGPQFTVTVDGDETAREQLRFKLADGTLGIHRGWGDWTNGWKGNAATVRITMPAPRKLVVTGSGRLTSAAVAREAEVSIAGSGTLETPQVDADSLDVSIAGSGSYRAAGQVRRLSLSIAGSGRGDMAGLRAEKAEINIAGSGGATFASDGEVEANIMGSGDVTVRGSARCTVHSMGSGSLKCEREPETAN